MSSRTSIRTGLIILAALSMPGLAGAAEWELDPSHSSVQFSVRHMMVSNTRGRFTKLTGKGSFDAALPTRGSVEIQIDAASVDTDEPKRDEHLRSPDFFDVAKHPGITFKSSRFETSASGLRVTGDLTIHGVTRQVVLAVDGPTAESKDPWGNVRVGLAGSTKINRKDFGLTWNKILDAGGLAVGDEIAIAIEAEFVKKGS